MPCSATVAPRMMLPPPMTTATCTPRSRTLRISSARYFVYSGEMPNSRSPSSASPESFSTTRPYLAFVSSAIGGSLGRFAVGLAQLEPLEPLHADVLAGPGGDARDELADRLRGISDVGLLQELTNVSRVHRRDLHRDLLRELPEIGIARHEVGLARKLDHRADATARVDVGLHDAFLCLAVRLLLCPGEPTFLDQRLGFFEVAFGFVQRSLAVHHARARFLAQALDVVFYVRHHSSSFLSRAASVEASSAGSSKRCPPIGYSSSSSGSYTRGVRFARGTPRPPSYCSAVVDGAYPMSSGVASLRAASNCWRP